VFLKLLWYKKGNGGKIMSVKNLLSTTILILLAGGCANSQTTTKVQAVIPKYNICVQKEGANFGICPDNAPEQGDVVWVSHKIQW
jgi:thiamine pyrophosphate-dependent acetolactate synthase large subunit-like protein